MKIRNMLIALPILFLISCNTAQVGDLRTPGPSVGSATTGEIEIVAHGDSPWVTVRSPKLDGRLGMIVPEVISDMNKRWIYLGRNSHGVQWRGGAAGRWTAHYEEPGAGTYDLSLIPLNDGIMMDWTFTNRSGATWNYVSGNVCMQNHQLPAFYDPEETRTFIRVGGEWVAVADAVETVGTNWLIPPGKKPCNLMRHLLEQGTYRAGILRPDEAIVAVRSLDGEWVLAQAWHEARYISVNSERNRGTVHACSDVSAYFEDVAPGETVHARGMIYLFKGDLEALVEKYHSDLADRTIMFEKK